MSNIYAVVCVWHVMCMALHVLGDSVPIADMGKFQEVLMRRAASGASTLRDPLLDLDEILRSPLASPFCLLPPPLDLKISSGKVIWCWVA